MNDKMNAYLFVHFVGTESKPEHEQIYFSVSKDGEIWEILNNGCAILQNTLSEKGARDPYIIRSPKDNNFCIIATDLSIFNRKKSANEKTAWAQCKNILPDNPQPGSNKMVVWKSNDLISWNGGLVCAAPDSAGCYWAPKCIWDKNKSAYMVFGASCIADDNYSLLRLYRSYTRDFKEFTEPELYIDKSSEGIGVFDVTIIECKNMYYRIFKTDRVNIEYSENLDDGWISVNTNIHSLAPLHEGPAICKMNGKNEWILMLDDLASHGGYQAFITDDLSKGHFIRGKEVFPDEIKYRHGSIIPITNEEYQRLIKAYGKTL